MARSFRVDEMKRIVEFTTSIIDCGVNGYLGLTLLGFATAGCAKVFIKFFTNETIPKYTGFLMFITIGFLTSCFFKIFKFNFLYEPPGFGIVLIINIILYAIIRQIKKPKKHIGNYYSK
mgnify:CR=1 FL=1